MQGFGSAEFNIESWSIILKDPNKTRKLILDSALDLFAEKGYSNTSTNDIRLRAGNLSRGGLYYFFPKKEDILYALPEYLFEDGMKRQQKILNNSQRTTLENVHEWIYQALTDINQNSQKLLFFQLMIVPEFLSIFLKQLSEKTTPLYYHLILNGNKDGSVNVKDPIHTAELLSFTLNIWFNPNFYQQPKDDIEERITYLDNLLRNLGIPLIDDKLGQALKEIWLKIKQ